MDGAQQRRSLDGGGAHLGLLLLAAGLTGAAAAEAPANAAANTPDHARQKGSGNTDAQLLLALKVDMSLPSSLLQCPGAPPCMHCLISPALWEPHHRTRRLLFLSNDGRPCSGHWLIQHAGHHRQCPGNPASHLGQRH